jgi:hypothetical protein
MNSNAPAVVAAEAEQESQQESQQESNNNSMNPIVKPLDLTEQCHHYQKASEVPWDIQK